MWSALLALLLLREGLGRSKLVGLLLGLAGVLLLITGGRVDGLQLLPFMPWSTLAAQFDVVSVAGWGAVLFLGLGCSGIAYLCWYASLA
jgi:drug/metabolite transporter (DMT)-like permease